MEEENSFTKYLLDEYIPVASKISGFLVLLIIIFMIGMRIYDKKLIDRVSLRLQTGIVFYDLWLHTGWLWRTPYSNSPSPMCTFIAWQKIALPLFYFFMNVSIGVNFQLIFLHNKTISKRIEYAYWIIPIIAALLISIPPLALDRLGFSTYSTGCFLKNDDNNIEYGKMFDMFANQLWRLLSMIYLIIIVILVVIKLGKGTSLVRNHRYFRGTNTSDKAAKSVKIMAYRILLYPITMVLSHSAGIISQFYYNSNSTYSDGLDQWTYLVYPLAGIFNFIAFCCDPTVHSAFRKIYLRVSYKYMISNSDVTNDSNSTTPAAAESFELSSVNTPESPVVVGDKEEAGVLTDVEAEALSEFARAL